MYTYIYTNERLRKEWEVQKSENKEKNWWNRKETRGGRMKKEKVEGRKKRRRKRLGKIDPLPPQKKSKEKRKTRQNQIKRKRKEAEEEVM